MDTGLAPVALVAGLALLSGAAALIFQVAWMRELRLVFGSTTAAASTVLAVFMGGLGLGSALLGSRIEAARAPLRWYGLFEIGIAVGAAISPWLIDLVSMLYIHLGGQQALGMAGATLVRISLTALVLAIPSFLMGGTLPAAARAVTRSDDPHRRALGVLYGANTLGAVVGAAWANFWALETVGVRRTLWCGCALGILAGTLAVKLAKPLLAAEKIGDKGVEKSLEKERHARQTASPGPKSLMVASVSPFSTLAYFIAGVLGFVFFAMELVWYRMLAPILGGSTFTFGLILCVALLGIGVGGVAYRWIFAKRSPSWGALAVTCVLEGVLILFPYMLGDMIAVRTAELCQAAQTFPELILSWSLIAGVVIFPTALVSGVQFPLLIALVGQGRTTLSKQVGATYAWNTLGAIVGSFLAGFVALPLLGAVPLWLMLGLILAAVGSLLALTQANIPPLTRDAVLAMGLLAAAACFVPGPSAAWRHSGVGAGRLPVSQLDTNGVEGWRRVFQRGVVWEADGLEASIGIKQLSGLDFSVNGKTDGNSLNDAPTQVGMAVLAAALHENPKTGLVIGLGTGETAGWLAEMREIEQVDVVELEPAIDEMARRCAELNYNALEHPRVRRIYADGREFVLSAPQQYDVIVSEPSNPYRAGVATLYTREFYAGVRRRLNNRGVFVQFVQAYEVDQVTIETVIATIHTAFPHVELWQTMPADLQLVCSMEPLDHQTEQLRKRIEDSAITRALRDVWRTPGLEGLLAHFVANRQATQELARRSTVLLNTDDRTTLEYRFAKTVGRATPVSIEQLRFDLRASGGGKLELGAEPVDWRRVELTRQALNAAHEGQFSLAFLPEKIDRQLVEALTHARDGEYAAAVAEWPAEHRQPATPLLKLLYARALAETGDEHCLSLLAEQDPGPRADAAAIRAIYHARRKDSAAAASALQECFQELHRSPWAVSTMTVPALSLAIELAQQDAPLAEPLLAELEHPFASWQFDYLRETTRWMIAREVGPAALAEALAPLEPLVPWEADLLEARANAYRELKHPRATAAAADWARYQSQ